VADVLDLTPSATVDRTVQDIIRLALNERALELGMAPLFSDFPGPDGGVRADVAASRRRSRALRARADRAMDASAELSATYARLAAHPRIAQR
jgi:hypothetical protein